MNITMQQMLALDAVVNEGSVQAGARLLHKTHPSVITALKNLEEELGFVLFDRSGYRSVLTAEGKAFHQGVRRILSNLQDLKNRARHIKIGEETELNIVLGDITPMADALSVLRRFVEDYPHTRINLFFENLYGPNEWLLDGKADLIIHHIDKSDPRYEYRDFCQVSVVPVIAPGFLPFPISDNIHYTDMQGYTQCIIRDTALRGGNKNYFVLDDTPHITVGDQHTKKEVILQRMAWGHMPLFLIDDELSSGNLISLEGQHIKGNTLDIVAARLGTDEKGRMAERLWQLF
ncbi:MAG: LysR family transcriptional regulator [Gammaproteobacteria bacterium]|nr:LysR family transcriptional regulator [Gammaproteobacteria bacterium]